METKWIVFREGIDDEKEMFPDHYDRDLDADDEIDWSKD